jgi:hypothetical protein
MSEWGNQWIKFPWTNDVLLVLELNGHGINEWKALPKLFWSRRSLELFSVPATLKIIARVNQILLALGSMLLRSTGHVSAPFFHILINGPTWGENDRCLGFGLGTKSHLPPGHSSEKLDFCRPFPLFVAISPITYLNQVNQWHSDEHFSLECRWCSAILSRTLCRRTTPRAFVISKRNLRREAVARAFQGLRVSITTK